MLGACWLRAALRDGARISPRNGTDGPGDAGRELSPRPSCSCPFPSAPTSPPPISLGSIILPLHRQLPTELPKALVKEGSGRGMFPCGPAASPDGGSICCCVAPGSGAAAFASVDGVVPPGFALLPCCAWA